MAFLVIFCKGHALLRRTVCKNLGGNLDACACLHLGAKTMDFMLSVISL